jgi:hypothetical protein
MGQGPEAWPAEEHSVGVSSSSGRHTCRSPRQVFQLPGFGSLGGPMPTSCSLFHLQVSGHRSTDCRRQHLTWRPVNRDLGSLCHRLGPLLIKAEAPRVQAPRIVYGERAPRWPRLGAFTEGTIVWRGQARDVPAAASAGSRLPAMRPVLGSMRLLRDGGGAIGRVLGGQELMVGLLATPTATNIWSRQHHASGVELGAPPPGRLVASLSAHQRLTWRRSLYGARCL